MNLTDVIKRTFIGCLIHKKILTILKIYIKKHKRTQLDNFENMYFKRNIGQSLQNVDSECFTKQTVQFQYLHQKSNHTRSDSNSSLNVKENLIYKT